MTKIVLDPGHGGKDSGATGHGLLEKNLNLDIARKVGTFLNDYDCEVIYTRKDDQTVSLIERSNLANEAKADLFLSIHINASNGKGEGFESFIFSGLSETMTAGIQKIIHGHVMDYLDAFKIANRGMKEANFHVLRETQMPAVLLENLFIDHPKDAELLKDTEFIEGLSLKITKGIADAMNLKKRLNWKDEAIEWLYDEGLLTDEKWKDQPDEPLPLWAVAILLRRLKNNIKG
jgi:N-acetylmuramoyl-L-alanine amidase